MTIYQGVDLLKAVERYESAFQEFRQAHHDVRDVLQDHLLFDRWQQLAAELGYDDAADDITDDAADDAAEDITDDAADDAAEDITDDAADDIADEDGPRARRPIGDPHEIELRVADLHDDLRELENRDGPLPGMADAWAD